MRNQTGRPFGQSHPGSPEASLARTGLQNVSCTLAAGASLQRATASLLMSAAPFWPVASAHFWRDLPFFFKFDSEERSRFVLHCMAKSIRSKSMRKNRAQLRTRLASPLEDLRTARLSGRLLSDMSMSVSTRQSAASHEWPQMDVRQQQTLPFGRTAVLLPPHSCLAF